MSSFRGGTVLVTIFFEYNKHLINALFIIYKGNLRRYSNPDFPYSKYILFITP